MSYGMKWSFDSNKGARGVTLYFATHRLRGISHPLQCSKIKPKTGLDIIMIIVHSAKTILDLFTNCMYKFKEGISVPA